MNTNVVRTFMELIGNNLRFPVDLDVLSECTRHSPGKKRTGELYLVSKMKK